MKQSGGHSGLHVSVRPRKYPRTKQQERIAEAARACGIKAGISREELMKAMKECIPEYFAKSKEPKK